MRKRKELANRPRMMSKSRLTMRTVLKGINREDPPINTEGIAESDFVMILYWLKNVVRVREQPNTFDLDIGDTTVNYTPDFQLEVVNGEWIDEIYIEIKSQNVLNQYPEVVAQLKRYGEALNKQGLAFCVITDKKMQGAVTNVHLFNTFSLNTVETSQELAAKIRHCLPCSFADLIAHFSEAEIITALAHKKIFLKDLSIALNKTSVISEKEEYLYASIFG